MNQKEIITAIVIGLILIALGVLSRVMTGTSSITALIPAFFGLPIAILGAVALVPLRQRAGMIAVTVLAFLGAFANFSVIVDLMSAVQSGAWSASTISRSLMFVLCAILLVVCAISLRKQD